MNRPAAAVSTDAAWRGRLHELDVAGWTATEDAAAARALEAGAALYLPRLAFALAPAERRFLDPRWASGARKNISLSVDGSDVAGAAGSAEEIAALRALLQRFRAQAVGLIRGLLPHYAPALRVARTSFRPLSIEGRSMSWRKDDTRLHMDAFPSSPNRGERILRVFSNVHPAGVARVWRIGEPFADAAARFLPRIGRQLPGSAWLLRTLRITKSRRSEYDHYMLRLHDGMKADLDYQRRAPQIEFGFPPGCSWICFSDQMSHAAMSGQYLMEQTLHLPVAAQYDPATAPLRVLERLTGRALV
jgi:hypothetical protein